MIDFRNTIEGEIFDYQTIMSYLKDYANPRMKLSSLLNKGDVLRVKKGLYVFGERYRRNQIPKELLANLIYGPSVLSLDYMLFYYGMIPEAVKDITSVTFKRPKKFVTPVGVFVYRNTPSNAFYLGVKRISIEKNVFLAACPERALIDKIRDDKYNQINNATDAKKYLFDNLRIDEEVFFNLDKNIFVEYAKQLKSKKALKCATILNIKGRDV